jgi:hypothetical protein
MIRQNIVDEGSSSEESGLPGMISDTSSSDDSDQEVREREDITATSLELQEVRQILNRAPNISCDNIVDHQQKLGNLHGGRPGLRAHRVEREYLSWTGPQIQFIGRTPQTTPVEEKRRKGQSLRGKGQSGGRGAMPGKDRRRT